MKYSLTLIGCYAAGTVTAYYTEYGFTSQGIHPALMARSPDLSTNLVSRALRLERRMDRHSRGSSPSATSITGPPSRPRSRSGSPSSNRGERLPSAKASASGVGFLHANGLPEHEMNRLVPLGGKDTIHSPHPYEPHAWAASTAFPPSEVRWPVKASANGKSVSAALATENGPGHILLTAPDKPPQQINVLPNQMRTAIMDSNVPGGARAQVVGSKGAVTSAQGHLEHMTAEQRKELEKFFIN